MLQLGDVSDTNSIESLREMPSPQEEGPALIGDRSSTQGLGREQRGERSFARPGTVRLTVQNPEGPQIDLKGSSSDLKQLLRHHEQSRKQDLQSEERFLRLRLQHEEALYRLYLQHKEVVLRYVFIIPLVFGVLVLALGVVSPDSREFLLRVFETAFAYWRDVKS